MTNWIGKNRKSIGLIRVSSSNQEDNTSWQTQKRDCEEYCRRIGLNLIEVIPIVESARQSDFRKKYSEALGKALKREIQHIVFHKYDRETRNLTDNEKNEILVREGKIVLHYVADGKVLHKGSSDTEFLMRDYHAVQNKHYSRDLSTKVRRAQKEKAESGWFPGCRPPDGYINQKTKSDRGFDRRRGSTIVPDPNVLVRTRILREFEIRAEAPTPTYNQIRRRIIAENLVPLNEIKKYHTSSIQRRLENIFYDSRFLWQGTEYKGLHDRIIPEDLFWRVQETFGRKNLFRKNPDALFGHGWLKCADEACGCSVVFDPKKKRIKTTGEIKTFKYYRCSNGKRVHPNLKGLAVSEESLMNQFSYVTKEISIQKDFQQKLLKAVNESFDRMRRAIKLDLENYESALTGLKQKENRAYDNYDAGIIDKEMYNALRTRLQDERVELTQQMKTAQLAIGDKTAETVESIIELANNAESLWKHMTPVERRTLLEKLLSNRSLDGITVRYEIIKPLRALSEMKEDSNWRRERDSNSRYGLA